MGNAKLASFCVQHAAFMNEGMNDNKPQQQTKSDTSATNRSKSAKTGGGQSKKKEEESAAATTANQSVTQQAVVFSFLKNFTKAISVLEHELKVKPNPEIYNLLGRVFMKAKRLNNAVTSFDESIECIMEVFFNFYFSIYLIFLSVLLF
jgi:tetratricopeptide (TPR) repeat protein